ncbi:dihydroorotase family protein [Acuticoccus sp. M5D2P5]|uniref:dihydroorotase n=1 Tax=Acuticoccus kalidii TaxID=2910977 RepID=UPI001F21D9E6|nr:dihydroorotase family protein [Acuticoccus kalidii]MCF3932951.1 dihydroorotase family protein [Acuticoccus kalidii]
MARPSVDTVMREARIVSSTGVREASIAIADGTIVEIGPDETMPAAREEIVLAGATVIPGAIDVHVHFRDPGFPHKEDWTSGTEAAAAGGITTVFEMPNTDPATASVAALTDKIARASAKAVVDFGIYGNVADGNHDALEPMIEAGAAAFKIYMGSDNPLVPAPSDHTILAALDIFARHGMRTTVHAENAAILVGREARLKAAGRTDAAAHLEQHADLAEMEAIQRIALYSRETGAPIHIAHLSSARSIPFIEAAKREGTDLSCETCPHYLTLSTEDGARLGANFLRVKPPVRGPEHKAPLRRALFDGTIDVLSTDHAPHRHTEKNRPVIWDCAPGFPGVETSMRLMLTAVATGELSLERYVAMAAEAPARLFRLAPRKGHIAVGADADIVVLDLDRRERISAARLHSKGNATPFEGMETIGLPVLTMVRGRTVMRAGAIVAPPGTGQRVTMAV